MQNPTRHALNQFIDRYYHDLEQYRAQDSLYATPRPTRRKPASTR